MGTEKVPPEFAALEAVARDAEEMRLTAVCASPDVVLKLFSSLREALIQNQRQAARQCECNASWCLRCAEYSTVAGWRSEQVQSAIAAGNVFPEPGITCQNKRAEEAEDKLSVELQALADKDKNEVFYLQRIADLDSQLDQLKAGYKELEAEVAKLNGLLERCQADAEKIAERNQ